jgi:hypothetical protein
MMRWWRKQEEGKVRGVRVEGGSVRERRRSISCSTSSKGKAREKIRKDREK